MTNLRRYVKTSEFFFKLSSRPFPSVTVPIGQNNPRMKQESQDETKKSDEFSKMSNEGEDSEPDEHMKNAPSHSSTVQMMYTYTTLQISLISSKGHLFDHFELTVNVWSDTAFELRFFHHLVAFKTFQNVSQCIQPQNKQAAW